MAQPIRIGFIGASVGGGSAGLGSWAARSHIPYLKSSHNDNLYKITALQNSSKESAEKAVKGFELNENVSCYGSPEEIASDPNVDIIAVSVNVPRHYEAIMPALDAGKNIFVEWPLARTLSDAEKMTQLAREKNLKTMVGLQARQSPSVIAAKKLVESGAIGEVLSTSMQGYGLSHSEKHSTAFAYGLPIEAGANILTIPFGHAIDALCFVLGELEYVQSTLAIRWPEFDLVNEKGEVVGRGSKTAYDHVNVSGILVKGGAVVDVFYRGGMNPTGGPGFVWQINGTKGTILLEGPMGHIQMYQPTIKVIYKGEKELQEVEGVHMYGQDFSYSVGKAWDAYAAQQRGEKVEDGCVTTFEDALIRHKMIDAIYRSNEKGTREKYI